MIDFLFQIINCFHVYDCHSRRSCSKLSAICLRSQDADMSCMVVPPIACDRTTIRVWSHHQSFVIVCRTISSSTSHKLFRLVAQPNGDTSHDIQLQSLAMIGGTCKRAITNDWRYERYDQSWLIVRLEVAINDQSYHQS